MHIKVMLNNEVVHEGVLSSLCHGREDLEMITEGEFPDGFGLLVEPPLHQSHSGSTPSGRLGRLSLT